jgi:hypothetical protein
MRRREFFAATSVVAGRTMGEGPKLSRPRLYFQSRDVARLRARIERDDAFRKRWTALIERAKRLLDSQLVPEDVAERGGGQHANYGQPGGQISEMGLTLGLAYHVTGERQYAEKLRQAMLYYTGYTRWNGQGLAERVPPWHSELNTARFCFGYGVGYDALHGFLAAEERKTIADGMVRLGILPTLDDWVLPENRIHALDSMGHNWWSVCVSMAGVCCLALLGDDERAPDWVDRVSRGLALWFSFQGSVLQNKPRNFDRRGAFYEGINHANYALSEYLRYRLAYSNVLPSRRQPRFPQLERATEFFLLTVYPTATSFLTPNIGDSGLHSNASATVRLLVENGFVHPCAGWHLTKAGPQRLGLTDPLELLARQTPPVEPPERLPRSVLYRDIGWPRSGWCEAPEGSPIPLAARS